MPSLSTFVPFLELEPVLVSFLAFLDVLAGRSSPLELSLTTKLELRLPILLVVQRRDDVSGLAGNVVTRFGCCQRAGKRSNVDVVVDNDLIQGTVGAMKSPCCFLSAREGSCNSDRHFFHAARLGDASKKARPSRCNCSICLISLSGAIALKCIRVRSWAGRGRGCAGSSADEWTTAVEK